MPTIAERLWWAFFLAARPPSASALRAPATRRRACGALARCLRQFTFGFCAHDSRRASVGFYPLALPFVRCTAAKLLWLLRQINLRFLTPSARAPAAKGESLEDIV